MTEVSPRAVRDRVALRLIPFLFLLYVVNILDRVNVSFAKLQMLPELQLGEDVYSLGFGLFYIGYLLFEVPSNLILHRVGARRWIARIMISWGLITCAMMLIRDRWGFYLLRILLGFAEAGFFPGIILYLTYWFPARERARMVALFMAASPLTGVVGNPLSGAIMEGLDEVAGLSGWQWIFLLEGIPAVVLGVTVLFYLTDRPEQAHWLEPAQRRWLADQLGREEQDRHSRHGLTLGRALADGRVWLLILLYFTVAAGSNAFGAYLPTLIKERFPDCEPFEIGLLAAIPNLVAVVCMVLNGAHSDRTGERRWHVALPAFVAALGWALTAWLESPAASLVALALVQAGIMSMLPTFWTLPTSFLSGVAAAGGIALINSVGNLGGFAGPVIIGQLQEDVGTVIGGGLALAIKDYPSPAHVAAASSFSNGLLAMALILAAGGVLALLVRHDSAPARQPASP
jgi:ACS family tartrate transporter-like MFS transporter